MWINAKWYPSWGEWEGQLEGGIWSAVLSLWSSNGQLSWRDQLHVQWRNIINIRNLESNRPVLCRIFIEKNVISQKSLQFMRKSNTLYCMSWTFGQGYSDCLKYVVLSVELLVSLLCVFWLKHFRAYILPRALLSTLYFLDSWFLVGSVLLFFLVPSAYALVWFTAWLYWTMQNQTLVFEIMRNIS